MTNQNSIVCIGELIIDFFCKERNSNLINGNEFIKHAGGAPANVASTISKLGGQSKFVGKVGEDSFGLFLEQVLSDLRVDTSMLIKDPKYATTLAFVSLTNYGERDFEFIRGADKNIHFNELDIDRLAHSKFFHFGSATALMEDPFRSTYVQLMEEVGKKGSFISFDPNYRHDLWKENDDKFKEIFFQIAKYANLIKVSEEELNILTGESVAEKGINSLVEINSDAIIVVTRGEIGSLLGYQNLIQNVPSINVNVVDTTGAGDAFVGGFLYKLSTHPDNERLEYSIIKSCVTFGNVVGALACEKIGGIQALPTIDEVYARLNRK